MNQNVKFILQPLSEILNEAVISVRNIQYGIETYPLSDYMLQSILLKMSGAQEQKMKCIVWEMANNNYIYRRDFLREKPGKTYSVYSEKKDVYTALIKQIKIIYPDFSLNDHLNGLDKSKILSLSNIGSFIDESIFNFWHQKSYKFYLKYWKGIKINHFANEDNVLLNNQNLGKIYEENFYKNRNRIAHNTRSSQQNLPSLNTLIKDDYEYENYFIFFSLLILIDHVFIELYKIYLNKLDYTKWL